MIRLFLLLSLFFSLQVNAHVERGMYKGFDQNGEPCSFKIGDTWFADEIEHPLTERLPITDLKLSGLKPKYDMWQLGHPPIVNLDTGRVGYNHDLFQDIIPTFSGAASVTLYKTETKPAKPTVLIYIEDHYKNPERAKKVTCTL